MADHRYSSSRGLYCSVIVAVAVMRVMKVAANKIIKMVSVRDAFMSAGGSVSVPTIMTFAVVVGCTNIRIDAAH
jgi:hypothetical protein